MVWYAKLVVLSAAALSAAVVFLGIVVAGGPSGGSTSSPGPTSTAVPPDCEPPKACPVLVDTDQDGYSDYDEEAYGSDPADAASTPESWALGSCEDGVDNDQDGAADGRDSGCSDPCASSPPMPATSPSHPDFYPYCDKDSDGDGFFDSDETGSGSDPADAASTPEDWWHGTCEDGADNDLDGVTDGSDAGCAEICWLPAPMPLAPASGPAPDATPVDTPVDGGGGSGTGQTCNEDTDGDGYSDWDELSAGSDAQDAGSTPEAAWYPGTCADGVDNDLDGQADSADDSCGSECVFPADAGPPAGGGATPPSQPCIADGDSDGIDDGTEEMLGSDPGDPDSTPEHLWFPDSCADGADNDGDALADAADPGCQPDADGDGLPDSADNCPEAWNPDQADANNDGTGDACQDSDGDGYSDAEETSWGSDPDDSASTPEVFWAAGACEDGQDNDRDGATDSGDSGCAFPEPLPPGSGMPIEFAGKDANCDLLISARDALVIVHAAAEIATVSGLPPCAATAPGGTTPGDADCSGAVEVADALAVLKYVGGLSPAPGLC
jgi:hypothetical protein